MNQEEKYKQALEQIVSILQETHLGDDIFSIIEFIEDTAKNALNIPLTDQSD